MLNEEKIRNMVEIASFEKGEGKEAIKISKYYRTDYMGISLLKSVLLATIGYGLLVGAWVCMQLEYLMNNIHKINIVGLGRRILFRYIGFVIVYFVIAYIIYTIKYMRAKKNLVKYKKMLDKQKSFYNELDDEADIADALGGNINDKTIRD